ncbi:MAG TPA: peptide chain release factor N(5)-glutamine methyltransferase [Albitalea sp.]|uniref:peptide chain release factor N(5)-glutamine methyltransferase n=1 Tax=Piscinibacter sp. TaxID=1903157 RepID=UPI002ED13860
MTTVGDALTQARRRGVDRLDAQLLLAQGLGRPRAWLLAHDDHVLTPPQSAAFAAAVERRARGEPLAYIVGEKEFRGLLLAVDDRVLVPRPDTETLVAWALELLNAAPLAPLDAPQVVDLGTGSGAIALAVAQACPRARVCALDASPDALAVARLNGQRLALAVEWLPSHWWDGIGRRRFHLALSNPPYVADDDHHLAALQHEPQMALRAGPDGLDAIRAIVAGAADHLEPGGWLLLEHGHDQSAAVQALLRDAGFEAVQSRHDLAGIARCSGARAPRVP